MKSLSTALAHGHSLVLLLLCPSLWVGAQEAGELPTRTQSVAELRSLMPESRALVERDGNLHLRSPSGVLHRVQGATPKAVQIVAYGVPIRVSPKLVQHESLRALDQLPSLLVHIEESSRPANDLLLDDDPLTGPHLISAEQLILPEGPLSRAPPQPALDLGALDQAVASVRPLLQEIDLTAPGRRSVLDVLDLLAARERESGHWPQPALARRAVRHAWLRAVLPPSPEVLALEEALAVALRMRPVIDYRAAGLRRARIADSFGKEALVLMTPERSGYATDLPAPAYVTASAMTLVVELPPGSDPLAGDADPRRAEVYSGAVSIASWSAADGFRADPATWRTAITAEGLRAHDTSLEGWLPPHLLLIGIDGDIQGLVTAHGSVSPAASHTQGETRRFIAEAAEALPDAAHLDLIGEYLFAYVYDSPDTRHPELMGSRENSGEIHQTAEETVATVAGGIFRGDCDDLAELYQVIAERQGRLCHVMNLPSHAALGWAEQDEEGRWHVFVLHTGPPREFVATELPICLMAAYRDFGITEAIDPDECPVAIRFSGENTRSPWLLGWRIFRDRGYARTMIDVQRDWHFHTYHRAIAKMQRLIADGDHDPANYRELASLHGRTGQYTQEATYLRKIIAQGEDAALSIATRLVTNLYQSGRRDEARAEVRTFLDVKLPRRAKELGVATFTVVNDLADVVIFNGKDAELGREILLNRLQPAVWEVFGKLAQHVRSPDFDPETWRDDPDLIAARRLVENFMLTAAELLCLSEPDILSRSHDLRSLTWMIDLWVQIIAFRDVHQPALVLSKYATVGQVYEAVLGPGVLDSLLDEVAQPEKESDHTTRLTGLSELRGDLPWIKTSVPFWTWRLIRLFHPDIQAIDPARIAALERRVLVAHVGTEELGFSHPYFDRSALLASLIASVVGEDAPALEEALRQVALEDDRSLRNDCTEWLGRVARFTTPRWYDEVLDAWDAAIGNKPGYYAIAWSAWANRAPGHALQAARLAARKFEGDAAFAEEYAHMQRLLSGR